jgi:NADPH:quinone reductase-like Zn-dependent oxidoreductase
VRAVVVTRHGPADVLRVEERPDPVAGPGQVVIDVRAAGVNFADVQARLGIYPEAPKPPCVLGYEVAGVVAETGEGVSALRAGDRVMAATRFGGYSERVVVGEGDCMPLPDRLSFAQGAAVPVAYATAWCALVRYGGLRAGERVLIQGAGGGVGIAALQIARGAGAEVVGTASPGKHEAVLSHSADAVFGYDDPGLGRFDLVIDPRGGRSLRRSFKRLEPGGRLVGFGFAGSVSGDRRDLVATARALAGMPIFHAGPLMSDSKAFIGLNLLRLWEHAGTLEPWMGPLQALLDEGTIQPVVSEQVPFGRAPDAHRSLTERRNVGKVVLSP